MTSGVKTSGVGTYAAISSPGSGSKRTWSGVDGKYSANGRLKWNNYSMTAGWRVTGDPKAYFQEWTNNPSPGHWFANTQVILPGFGGTAPSLSNNDILKLQAKLAEKVKGHDWNLAVDASQLRQTSNLVVDSLRTLGKAALALRHGNVVAAARAFSVDPSRKLLKARNVGSRWLELQYGWLPLLSSVHEASKAYHAITKGERKITLNVQKTKSSTISTVYGVTKYKHDMKNTMYLKAEVYEDLSTPRSLGLEDPLSVLWENIPFSFVVDWFIPIGTYISNLNTIPAIKGRFLTTTVLRDSGFSFEDNCGVVHAPPQSGDKKLSRLPSVQGKEVTLVRTSSTSLFVPKPTFIGSGAIHGARIANAIALSGPIFRKVFGN